MQRILRSLLRSLLRGTTAQEHRARGRCSAAKVNLMRRVRQMQNEARNNYLVSLHI